MQRGRSSRHVAGTHTRPAIRAASLRAVHWAAVSPITLLSPRIPRDRLSDRPHADPELAVRAGLRRCRVRPVGGDASRGRTGARRRTPTCGRAVPTRPGSSATSPGTSPSAGSPTSTSATRRSCSAASTWRTGRAGTSGGSPSRTRSTRPLVVDWRAPVVGALLPGDRGGADGGRAAPAPDLAQGPRARRPRRRGVRPGGDRRGRAADRGRRRAARRARTQPHRPHGRHRRHDPGRAGRSDPRRARRRRSSSPAGRARARPRSRSTAPRTSSTRSAAGWARRACCSSGPSPVFLRYIEHVLPSLGEQDVQLSTIAGPPAERARRAAPTPTRTAALKGDARMARVIERAVADRERPLRHDFTIVLDGLQLRVRRARDRHASSKACNAGAARTTSSGRSSRSGSSTSSSARYKTAAIRSYQRRADDARDANVTSMFDRDTTLDASVAGALVRGEALARRLGAGDARPLARPARGEGGPRPHVAGAVGRRARSTTSSASPRWCARPPHGLLDRRRAGRAAPAARARRRERRVDRRRRRADRRGRRAARAGRGRPPRAAAHARAATRSSTRRPA